MDGFDHDGVRKEFNIPENYWIPLLLAVGYFDKTKQLFPPKWRKAFDDIVVKFNCALQLGIKGRDRWGLELH